MSHKGRNGGFKLLISPDELSLLDLIEVFQGEFRLNSCYNRGQKCPIINDCQVREKIENVEKNMINDLSKISMKMLIDENK